MRPASASAGDVARARLVVVRVGARRARTSCTVEPVAGHAAREVVDREDGGGDAPLARRAAVARAGSGRRDEHDHEEGGGGPTNHAANVSIRVVSPPGAREPFDLLLVLAVLPAMAITVDDVSDVDWTVETPRLLAISAPSVALSDGLGSPR